MSKIIAYHSNLYFDSFVSHVEEIKAKGFDVILFCISETDMLYNLQIFKEFKNHAESEGLETWATFWGYTAGEAICKKCDVYKWLYEVTGIGYRNILVDEPKETDGFNYIYDERFNDLNFHLCLTDDAFNRMSDQAIKVIPVKSFGVSNYHWIKDWMKITMRSEAIARRLHSLRPDDNFIFLQGFDIPDGWEDIPMIVKDICENEGITNFAFWSFRSTIATGTKRPANPELVWEKINF